MEEGGEKKEVEGESERQEGKTKEVNSMCMYGKDSTSIKHYYSVPKQ